MNKNSLFIIFTVIVFVIITILYFSSKTQTFCELTGGKWDRGPLLGGKPTYERCFRGDPRLLNNF